jgi:hypothetical protein
MYQKKVQHVCGVDLNLQDREAKDGARKAINIRSMAVKMSSAEGQVVKLLGILFLYLFTLGPFSPLAVTRTCLITDFMIFCDLFSSQ